MVILLHRGARESPHHRALTSWIQSRRAEVRTLSIICGTQVRILPSVAILTWTSGLSQQSGQLLTLLHSKLSIQSRWAELIDGYPSIGYPRRSILRPTF